MSKIVGRLLENVTWLQDLAGVLTVFFLMLFVVIVIRVIKLKKEQVDEYKNLPLSNDKTDDI
jgi:hypothetical protein